MKTWLFTCKKCSQVFKVPYHEDTNYLTEEDITVIEHEEAHTENGEEPGWDVKLEEEN